MRWLLLLLTLNVFGPPVLAQESNSAARVCVIVIREDITHNTTFLVRRALKLAADRKVDAVVVDMDTNGGRVDSTEEIIRLLEAVKVPTSTYINNKAFSAGAFIAAATEKIYMAPGSVIGAATPVMIAPGSGAQELPKSYEEKIGSAMRGLIRATAQQNGHNAAVFEAMVDREAGLVIEGQTITEKGKLLTLTNDEAARQYGDPPKPLLSAGTLESLDQVLHQLGLAGAEVVTVRPSGFEVVARWITAISPLLILIGMAAIYLELKTPGLGIPTVVAIIAFSIFFLGFFLAGLSGWEEAVIFGIGLTLLLVEIFILPGFGIAGVLGLALMLGSLVMAMISHWPGGPMLNWGQLQLAMIRVAIGFIGSVVLVMILGRYLPQTSLFRKLELSAATDSAAGYTSGHSEAAAVVGATGKAETQLRPAGKARFGEQLVDVVTEGDLIDRGTPIRITSVQGSRVVVVRVS